MTARASLTAMHTSYVVTVETVHEWRQDGRARRTLRFVCDGCGEVRWATSRAKLEDLRTAVRDRGGNVVIQCREAVVTEVMAS